VSRFALPVLLLAMAACTSRREWHARSGNSAAAAGDFEAASAAFRRALAAGPEDAHLYALLGSALLAGHHESEAQEAWARALQLEPAQLEARLGLSALDLTQGHATHALALLEGLAAPEARVLRARGLLERGAGADASQALQELEGLEGPDALFLRGSALLVLRRFGDAEAVFEHLERSAPLLSRYGLARLAAAQGRSTDALLHLSAARSAAGERWALGPVRADPAFEFLTDSADFQALTAK
jgi:Flp pilus assembly protein TadD